MATQPQPEQRALSVQTSPLILQLAERWQMNAATMINTIKGTVMPQKDKTGAAIIVTDAQLMMFLQVCHEYKLNPFLKQIFAFPSKGGGIVPMVPVDGWSTIVNRDHPEMDGLEFDDIADSEGKLQAIRCRIYRKDRKHATEVTEYMQECFMPGKEPWVKWPARMLRHKAYIQCARIAFGLSGIYDPDEAERIMESEERRNGEAPRPIERPRPVIQGHAEPKAEVAESPRPEAAREEAQTASSAPPEAAPANGAGAVEAEVKPEPAPAPEQPTGAELFPPVGAKKAEAETTVEYATNFKKLFAIGRAIWPEKSEDRLHEVLKQKWNIDSAKKIPKALFPEIEKYLQGGLTKVKS